MSIEVIIAAALAAGLAAFMPRAKRKAVRVKHDEGKRRKR